MLIISVASLTRTEETMEMGTEPGKLVEVMKNKDSIMESNMKTMNTKTTNMKIASRTMKINIIVMKITKGSREVVNV